MYQHYIKRLIDVCLSVLGIIALAIPMAIIAIAIRIDSDGPSFFSQERLGKNKDSFTIYKFRTMVPHAFEMGGLVTNENDDRITSVGSYLRKTSLDELPQLINIIKGDMAIIGPRPCLPHEYDEYESDSNYVKRFEVLPGLFCSVDVELRAAADFDTQFRMDAEYVDDISFTNDLRIFFCVLKNVFARNNVYKE